MSREIALANINLERAPRWGRTEYSINYHKEYFRRRTGVAPESPAFPRAIHDDWNLDFIWSVNNGLHANWGERGRATDMGHAVYASDGSDRREPRSCPFEEPEDVWAFDPVAEYGLPDFDEQVAAYEANITGLRERFPNQLPTGGYYRTIVSGAIETFGWDMLLVGASDPAKMEKVFDGFFRFTLHHMKAWAETSVEVIIQHDDFVWTAGAFMNPEIYRQVIIPRYAELWKPLKAAGKKVLFCSDGDFTQFAPDVAEAGADGFIFEPMIDFGYMTSNFGKTHCLVGSHVDCRDMTFGSWETVKATIDKTMEALDGCKGAIFTVGNHLPDNIPAEMMDKYVDYVNTVVGV